MKEESYCQIEQFVMSIKNIDKKLIDGTQFIKELRSILGAVETEENKKLIVSKAQPRKQPVQKTRKMICSRYIIMNAQHTKLVFQRPSLRPILVNILQQCGYKLEMPLKEIGNLVDVPKHYVWYIFSALSELGLITQERRGRSGYTYVIDQDINKYL